MRLQIDFACDINGEVENPDVAQVSETGLAKGSLQLGCSGSMLHVSLEAAFNVVPWECLLAAVVSPCGISSQCTVMTFSPGLVTVQRVVSLGCNKLCFFRCIITSTGSSNVYH